MTIRNGSRGIYNRGTLTINYSTVSGNVLSFGMGGGILNTGTLTINNSTVSGNQVGGRSPGYGGGIYNWDTGSVTINNSTISVNVASCGVFACGAGADGGIYTVAHYKLTIAPWPATMPGVILILLPTAKAAASSAREAS